MNELLMRPVKCTSDVEYVYFGLCVYIFEEVYFKHLQVLCLSFNVRNVYTEKNTELSMYTFVLKTHEDF